MWPSGCHFSCWGLSFLSTVTPYIQWMTFTLYSTDTKSTWRGCKFPHPWFHNSISAFIYFIYWGLLYNFFFMKKRIILFENQTMFEIWNVWKSLDEMFLKVILLLRVNDFILFCTCPYSSKLFIFPSSYFCPPLSTPPEHEIWTGFQWKTH